MKVLRLTLSDSSLETLGKRAALLQKLKEISSDSDTFFSKWKVIKTDNVWSIKPTANKIEFCKKQLVLMEQTKREKK